MNWHPHAVLVLFCRIAKRKLDDWSFFGGVLHVCYAPEYETVQETREKLQDRRKAIAAKVQQYGKYILAYSYSLAQGCCGGDIGSVLYVCMYVHTYVHLSSL